jgi:hypothetical protein
MSEVYVVAGPPRSGTSVTAGILHALGVNMGFGGFINDNQPIVDESGVVWNAKGMFACRDFHLFCSRYLKGLDRPSDTWSPDSEGAVEMAALLSARSHLPKWGLKGTWSIAAVSPLVSLNLPVRLIVCNREVSHSQESFTARTFSQFKEEAPSFVADMRARVDSVFESFNGPKLAVSFDALFDNTESTLQSLADFVELPLNDDARNMIDPSGRRHL